MTNLFNLPEELPGEEILEQLLVRPGTVIERIVSSGQKSPPGFWYDQPGDEWVVLLQGQAVLSWPSGHRRELKAGDYVFIPAHEKHRVDYTSKEPPCIWLAVHMQPR